MTSGNRDRVDHVGAEALAVRVRSLRERALLTQEDLAERSGVSVGTISGIEVGRIRQPRPSTLQRLADALGLAGPQRVALLGSATRRPGAGAEEWVALRPRQLPADVTSFTGRRRELAELEAVLAAVEEQGGPVMISAIQGTGGIGKSALAIHAAHRLAEQYPDGQLYVDLHGSTAGLAPLAPLEVLGRFLRALGVDPAAIPAGLDEAAARFRSELAGRRLLVVLDNARDAAQVRPLLPATSGCRVLVTSRRALVSLDGAAHLHLDMLGERDAVELLGRLAGPERVAAEPKAAAEVARLCGRLPLALRIAGARLAARPHWEVGSLVARLANQQRRLDELEFRDIEVRASLALSYQEVGPAAQRMFGRLGLLEVPDFAAWVGAALLDTTVAEAEDLIEQLVDARLLDVAGRDPTREVRYRLHDLTRAYARERGEATEPQPARTAALAMAFSGWLALAEQAHNREYGGPYTLIHGRAPRWPPASELADKLLAEPLAWLEAERVSIGAAVGQAARLGLDELCWDLAMTAVTLFEARSYFDDWRDTSADALRATRRAGNQLGEAVMLYSLGTLHLFQQRHKQAAELLDQALQVFEPLGERHGYALTQLNLAFLDRVQGRLDAALGRYEQARPILHETGDLFAECHVMSSMAHIALEHRRYEAAERLLEDALVLGRRIGSRRIQAQVTYRLGERLAQRGALDRARAAFTDVLRSVQAAQDRIGEAYALLGLGEILCRQHRHQQARAHLEQALGHAQTAGERLVEGRVLLALGKLHTAQRQHDRAFRALQQSLELFCALEAPAWQARTLTALGELHEAAGCGTQARRAFDEAHRLLASVVPS